MAVYLQPDAVKILNGVKVNEFFLTKHNPNKIDLPAKRILPLAGVTVHNTDWITVNPATTPAEQYTRATYNGNMKTTRVHFYADTVCAWQNLPLDYQSWHAGQSGRPEANGSHIGNQATISIEIIMGGKTGYEKAEDNGARLAAWLLYTNGLGIDKLFTHNYWVNVRNGVKAGAGESLLTKPDGYKGCPAYIIPHWTAFAAKVEGYLNMWKLGPQVVDPPANTNPSTTLYRVQIGAFASKDNANNYLQQVKAAGYGTAFMLDQKDAAGKLLYKIQVGAFSVKDNATNYVKEVKNKGFDAFVVEHKT